MKEHSGGFTLKRELSRRWTCSCVNEM